MSLGQSLNVSPASGNAPLTVTFNVTNYYSGLMAYVNWIFGDGTSQKVAIGTPVTHTYTQAGTYTVSAQILTSTGAFLETLSGTPLGMTINVLPSTQTQQASIFSSPLTIILIVGAAVGILVSKKKGK